MDAYAFDWPSLLLRWLHIGGAIAWIGGALHVASRGRAGEPAFAWQAYLAWGSGALLLALVYYWRPALYLVDTQVMALSGGAAVGIGLGTLVIGLALYEALCRSPLGRDERRLAAAGMALLALAAWALTQLLSARGAFLHYGAMLGTIMAGNVGHFIAPAQRRAGDAARRARAERRALHNTYLALPALFAMVAVHYPASIAGRWNWLILVFFTAAGFGLRAAWPRSR